MKTNWLSDYLKRYLMTRENSDAAKASTTPDLDVVKKMVRGIVTTRPDELDCGECFEQVDRFAEMVLEGRDVNEALPLVQDHLEHCRDCREEFEALMAALRALS
jgi:hypothetical protein